VDVSLTAAGIGAAAGLVTGLSGALLSLRGVRLQAIAAMQAQRQQWELENRRAAYSAVIATSRELMMAWWALSERAGLGMDVTDVLRERIIQAWIAFQTASGAATLIAEKEVLKRLEELRQATYLFDEYGEKLDFVNRKRWKQTETAGYDELRIAAENTHEAFISAARANIQELAPPMSRPTTRRRWPQLGNEE
jgi:hypothetical protein